jgi:hypothetical protein
MREGAGVTQDLRPDELHLWLTYGESDGHGIVSRPRDPLGDPLSTDADGESWGVGIGFTWHLDKPAYRESVPPFPGELPEEPVIEQAEQGALERLISALPGDTGTATALLISSLAVVLVGGTVATLKYGWPWVKRRRERKRNGGS